MDNQSTLAGLILLVLRPCGAYIICSSKSHRCNGRFIDDWHTVKWFAPFKCSFIEGEGNCNNNRNSYEMKMLVVIVVHCGWLDKLPCTDVADPMKKSRRGSKSKCKCIPSNTWLHLFIFENKCPHFSTFDSNYHVIIFKFLHTIKTPQLYYSPVLCQAETIQKI